MNLHLPTFEQPKGELNAVAMLLAQDYLNCEDEKLQVDAVRFVRLLHEVPNENILPVLMELEQAFPMGVADWCDRAWAMVQMEDDQTSHAMALTARHLEGMASVVWPDSQNLDS